MRRQKHHIISIPLAHRFINITGNTAKFIAAPSCVFARNVIGNKKRLLLLPKRRFRIDLIVFFFAAEQPLIILDWQKRRRKQDTASSLLHTSL